MSSPNTPKKKPLVNLPFPLKKAESTSEEVYEDLRPKPRHYADRTWMPPRGTRKSMGKR
ncbi:hypothetical protein ABEF79_10620 [Acinetobacter sp. ANC 7454]|uniref:hypothetical protein n=1 Tax=Acinetobacter thermotolerans TaxID=3151487 RepID=UPI00325A7A90